MLRRDRFVSSAATQPTCAGCATLRSMHPSVRLPLALAGLLVSASILAQQNIPGPGTSDMRQGQSQKFGNNPLVADGDNWYSRRQEGRSGDVASPLPIN